MLNFVILSLISLTTVLFSQNWQIQKTPDVAPDNNLLRTIDAASPNDIWAGGFKTDADGKIKNLLLHFNGSEWTEIPSPNSSIDHNDIWGIAALSEKDAWAVGVYNPAGGASQMQMQRWNGSEWNVYPSPALTGGSFLFGIDAVSPNDIWAVGTRMSREDIGPIEGLAMHWNGSAWTEIPVPPVGQRRNRLRAVDGLASNDVWAVGHWTDQLGSFNPLAMHWNGDSWTGYKLPGGDELVNVYMISSNDVWAVGNGQFFHYDGNTWQQVSSPGGGSTIIKSLNGRIFSLGANVVELDNNQWQIRDNLASISAPALTASVVLPNGDMYAAGRQFVSSQIYSSLIIKHSTEPGITSVDRDVNITKYELLQNYPNPFNPVTTIKYQIPEAGIVSLKVYNLIGQEIATLVNTRKAAGEYTIQFDAHELNSGIYFYKLSAGNKVYTRKMIVLK